METKEQLSTLQSFSGKNFSDSVGHSIHARSLKVFQINVGKWCNQACRHCHVDASPIRTEMMDKATIDLCLEIIAKTPGIETVDITGGAPEGNPHFKDLVLGARKLGKRVMDRCNLTILEEPGNDWLYDFLASNQVEVVSSLPSFIESTTDNQRGKGVYQKSITALKKLNALGYGTKLPLNLVYNPNGLFLGSGQSVLEREYKETLQKKYGIVFNQLFCINNLPISRFLGALVRGGKFEMYMETLANAYNPATVEGLMCLDQISVGYDGSVYDCDFNQMLDLKSQNVKHLKDFDLQSFLSRDIVVANHCYGCTAGAGSSCGGEIV
ncbi:radical SAM/Cys-rich domain protein [Leptospira congkakensis]|uniref:Radical SAM/Cys-rich domain protein n=1 Tax=Leptospira congkakensis TaxID=2484932 RepID=A0A4Z1ADJ7_9LEPT|nr:arsenosugar biosynthesis radical SAM (seleno)protein ArsS [Leptospira congkakensis]TGL86285.1 radical SAM/Cys-rich domain protein [Leptospira congkakensis]TGL94170.1 radical SAM/Cys-rich domain protein [Leptospira congkakensis]TGL94422.1 radical SAM/Cys-rich domain protein [Leptospira congkakensis]